LGLGYAFLFDLLRDDGARRSEAWRAISDVVPSAAVVARLHETAPPGQSIVCVAASDWPVVVALDGQRPLRDLVSTTGMASFAICEAVHRLVTAGLASVVDDGLY
jgi:hypothetical protein